MGEFLLPISGCGRPACGSPRSRLRRCPCRGSVAGVQPMWPRWCCCELRRPSEARPLAPVSFGLEPTGLLRAVLGGGGGSSAGFPWQQLLGTAGPWLRRVAALTACAMSCGVMATEVNRSAPSYSVPSGFVELPKLCDCSALPSGVSFPLVVSDWCRCNNPTTLTSGTGPVGTRAGCAWGQGPKQEGGTWRRDGWKDRPRACSHTVWPSWAHEGGRNHAVGASLCSKG